MRAVLTVVAVAILAAVLTGSVAGAAPGSPFTPPLTTPLLGAETAAEDALILYDVTTGARRDLRLGEGAHRLWGFSPDGCRILYTLRTGDRYARAFTARLDGTDARPLLTYDDFAPADWGVWEPVWSPAGDRIAFTLIRRTADSAAAALDDHRIAWVGAPGDDPGALPPVPAFYSVTGDEHMPRWSPDGAWLTYLSFRTGDTGQREADLWLVSIDGATKYRLTEFTAGSVSTPRWSPDGSLIAFVYSPRPFEDQYFMIARERGSIPTQLSFAPATALDLQWMPDGAGLAASILGMQGEDRNVLWRLPLIGRADTDAVPLLPVDALPYAAGFRFSADGAFAIVRADYEAALVDMASGAITRLDLPLANTAPHWSPAGFGGESTCPA